MPDTSSRLIDTRTLILPAILSVLLVFSSQISFLLFHTLAESFAIFVALLSSVVIWQMYAFTRNHFLMYLGCGYFWIATLDMAHTLVYKGLNILPVTGADISVQLWIGARFLEATLLLTAPWFLAHSLKRNLTFTLFSVITTTLLILIFSGNFPIGFIEGDGLTKFKIYSEYIIIGMLAAAMFHLTRQRKLIDQRVFKLMIASIALTMMAELSFTYYTSVYDISNLAGHIFKLFSFWMIYIAVVRTTLREPFSALSKAETHYDAVPDATIIIDKEGIIKHVNKAACLLANKPTTALIGINAHNVFHDQNIDKKDCPICQSVVNKTELSAYELKIKDTLWCDFSTSIIHDEDSFIEVIRDITNKKTTETALVKSEGQLRTLTNTLPDLVWLKDPDGVYLSCNLKFERFFGAKENEIVGKTDYDFVGKELADSFRRNDKIAMAAGRSSTNEEELTYADDGHSELNETIKTPMFDTNGELIGILGIARDITERKKMEKAFQENAYNLLAAQAIAKIGNWKIFPETGEIEGSKELYNIFSLGENEHTLKSFTSVVHPNDRRKMLKHVQNGIDHGTPWDIEYRLLLKDGSKKWVHAVGEPVFDIAGKTTCLIGIIQDITARKNADETLRRSQKLDALGQLTGGIAHDYNNMLGVIMGYAELLDRSLNDHPKQKKYANEIISAGKRGAKLTQKLLAFSQKNVSDPKKLNINNLLQNIRHMLEKTLTVRVKLAFDFEKNLWPVLLDDSGMEDAILNMSINAMHAIEGTGQLTFRTRNEHINESEGKPLNLNAGDYVTLSISDTGTGMDTVTREKIFEPFYSTKGDKGTGLGLSQVYGFVQHSDGAIAVYSEPHHGTEFILYFPCYRGGDGDEKTEEQHRSVNFTGSETILVVDDEPALLELTCEILTYQGFKVISSESAKKALEIIEYEQIDLLISDIIMPEMDGYQLAAIVQEKYPSIKIQLASGFADETNMDMIDEILQQNILLKPFNSKTLLQRIKELLNEK